jgi:phage gpG-like protein
MLTLDLVGAEALEARLDSLPAELLRDLSAKAAALAAALGDKVRDDKLSGEVLNAISGALRASIVSEASVEGDRILVSVGSAGDIKYAAIQEYGGRTAAHEILPNKAEALAFIAGGALRFAKRVAHPGSTLPERSYLRASLEEMTPEIVAALAAAPGETWSRL